MSVYGVSGCDYSACVHALIDRKLGHVRVSGTNVGVIVLDDINAA